MIFTSDSYSTYAIGVIYNKDIKRIKDKQLEAKKKEKGGN